MVRTQKKMFLLFADPCLLAAPIIVGELSLHAIKIAGTLSEKFLTVHTQDVKADARNAPSNFSSRFPHEIEIFSC